MHAWDVPPANLALLRHVFPTLHFLILYVANSAQLYYVSQILYVVVQNAAKLSILLLYLRIFPGARFRLWTKIMIAWVVCHTFAFGISITLQCLPFDALWESKVEGKCINPTGIVYTCAAFSILEDMTLILLPIPELKSLNLSLRKRIALIFMFALGSL